MYFLRIPRIASKKGDSMHLKEFITKYKLTYAKFCRDCGISQGTLWNCLHGVHKPTQRIAEVIEDYTQKMVTVKDLRGRDDRERFIPDNT